MTAYHSPGPWGVVRTRYKGDGILGVTIDGGKRGFPIADLGELTGQDLADANLIAAAPDLLAALQSLMTESATLDEPDTDAEVIFKMREIARAAISKAEGRS